MFQVSYRITPAGAGKTYRKATQASASRDHPRRCGENADKMAAEEFEAGSPPQVRGKHTFKNLQVNAGRITPAGAGKTQAGDVAVINHPDHPRRCGENRFEVRKPRRRRGSPPQVRGKRNNRLHANHMCRITPAGAGKTETNIQKTDAE